MMEKRSHENQHGTENAETRFESGEGSEVKSCGHGMGDVALNELKHSRTREGACRQTTSLNFTLMIKGIQQNQRNC